MKKITEEWIEKAEEDYIVAIRELDAEPPALYAVTFHAQQCVEKYMKAVLQENEIDFEKIHDLDVLLQKCRNIFPQLENYRNDLVKLSTYAVDIRYPGFVITKEEAEKSLNIMKKLRRIIREYLKLPVD